MQFQPLELNQIPPKYKCFMVYLQCQCNNNNGKEDSVDDETGNNIDKDTKQELTTINVNTERPTDN